MEYLFLTASLCLFSAAIGTMVLIIREARPHLNQEDQKSFRKWTESGFATSINRALKNGWNQHARSFPRSRKRSLFTLFLFGAALLLMAYPLWLVLGTQ